ncbi:MAG TPA: hypothetical protein EYP47_01805 [Methanococcaceae archaeon]|uniref:Uncharacterized protein n=1 Tax=Methanothermococcus okinawensis TaxID=155863 RepID=A0A832ZKR2_9EURY|nr:hypothetical protein [Methanococcaceae archaeon]HIP91256.1 hypothetical protein [Methanothermococcus okinawensis]
MASENIKKFVEEVKSQVQKEGKYIELVFTIYYLINLVEPSKRDSFREAINNAESIEDAYEILNALKLQIGAQGAKKLLKSL